MPRNTGISSRSTPPVVEIARYRCYFSFLACCAGDSPITFGDARLALGGLADQTFDLLIIDGFRSDAIPVHFLTREVQEIYLRKIGSDGISLLNVSNPHPDLVKVLRRTTDFLGLAMLRGVDEKRSADRYESTPSDWIALVPIQGGAWADDYSNIIEALR